MYQEELKKKPSAQWGAFVWIKWKPGAPEDACHHWKQTKEIKEAWTTAGKWDCALWIDKESPAEIERLVWKEIQGNKWVAETETHIAKKFW